MNEAMELDVATDLLNKAQIGFREAVGVSSFDWKHTNLPSVPTLDPSPSYLRCKFCQGKLLRGLQSLICIYCGEYQKNDLNPISFNSTHAYNCFEYVSRKERVGSLAEENGINGGQSPAEDELTLSELLGLKISRRVPDVPEEQPVSSKADQNKIFEDQESFTSDWNAEFQFADTKMENENLGTPNFDFFTESKIDVVSGVPEEQPVSIKADQNKTFGDQERFTSDWNSDSEFQFADSKMDNENFESVDPHLGADADLSAHMDMIFGQKEINQKPIDDYDPFQDLFSDMNSIVQAKDGLSGDLNDINFKHVDEDWFSDGNWQNSSCKNVDIIKDGNLFDIKPQIDPVTFWSGNSYLIKSDKHHSEVTDWFQDNDGFDEWNDFTSSTGNQDSRKENSNERAGSSEKISELNLFPSTDDSQVDFGKLLQSDIFSGDKNPSDTQAGYDIFSEISTASMNANTEAGNSVEGPNNDEITPNATRPENDVQMLLSQMHDLPFVLKNELSIPSKTR
ncbi:hypothetical protein L1987_78454 [Smallanthus sonchifolius]|uniref:Uncharacterized protein n=1 Tax=Smallanthus sonchifolius TaxID=185202 RepID=A0ACB8ZCX6_9ASTR|nr:hypothetical protein L1987_78454 [Smallanthus sonchifolius]